MEQFEKRFSEVEMQRNEERNQSIKLKEKLAELSLNDKVFVSHLLP